MHIEPRLLVFTRGVRARIAATVAVGLLGVGLGIARLALLGWLIGQVFAGKPLQELVLPVVLIAIVMVLRGAAGVLREGTQVKLIVPAAPASAARNGVRP